jgi:O-antigen ligase
LLAQSLLVFWVAYNLLSSEQIAKTTLWLLVAASVALRVFALLHLVHSHRFLGRLYIMGQNPNTMAHHVCLGLVALIGLATARKSSVRWPLILVVPCAVVMLYTIVQSGSRGGVTTAAIGVLALAFQGGSFGQQIRAVLVCVLASGFLYWAVGQSGTMTRRYDKTLSDGDMAGREDLFPKAWEMFLEKPLLGWGPIDNWSELGRRAPDRRDSHPEGERDPHNLVLEALTSTGLAGAIPIFMCLGLCTRAAWRARASVRGALPFAMVVTVFVVNMSGNYLLASKADWVVLAYAAASGNLVQERRFRRAGARVDRSPEQLADPTASLGLPDGLKRPNSPPAGAEPQPRLQQPGEPT